MYGIFEIGATAYDLADLAITGINCLRGRASRAELGVTAAGVGLGLVTFGGGYGRTARSLTGFAPGKWLTHFEKHGAEFGYKNAVEYLKGANRLIQGGDGVETYVRRNGDMLFYGEATNEFAVVAKDGKTIRTYSLRRTDVGTSSTRSRGIADEKAPRTHS